MNTTTKPNPWIAWAQLVRLPNVFTILADVAAAFLLVAGSHEPVGRFSAILLTGIALYWAGMILNDVFDYEQDLAERSRRPLPAGHISLGQARAAGWGLLALGIVLGWVSGMIPAGGFTQSLVPGIIASLLAVAIVLYDGPLKKTPLAPTAMGTCRVLSFLLGASVCLPGSPFPWFPGHVLAVAAGFGIYITGITTMARREAVGGSSTQLAAGLTVAALGVALILLSPKFAPVNTTWKFNETFHFPVLVGLVFLPVARRGIQAIRDPQPQSIQNSIRTGILTIIPLSAVVALLGAGMMWSIIIMALIFPCLFLASRLRVT